MITIEDFLPLKPKQLAERMATGHPVDPAALENYEYKGISLGLPAFIDKLAWKTFKKTFYRDPQTGVLRGWNIRIQQTGLHGKYLPKQLDGKPACWGHYQVVTTKGRPIPRPVPQTALIDYSLGGNGRFEFTVNPMRDPLVALEKDSAEVLLGWSYYDLGWFRFSTPSYFLLLRDCPVEYVAHPPSPQTR